MLTALTGLALATLISEDIACVAAGTMVAEGRLGIVPAVVACALGIAVGDVGLWLAGRAGDTGIRLVLRRRREEVTRGGPGEWLHRNAAAAIVASRFMPGTRLPLYVTAGVVGVPAHTFVPWSAAAAFVWTPIVVLLAARLAAGAAGADADDASRYVWMYAAGAAALPILALARALVVPPSRRQLAARLARWSRWEFWPSWILYGPVALWISWLSIRHGGLSTLTAANPGIPDGGSIGESKFDILSNLPDEWVVPSLLVVPAALDERVGQLRSYAEARDWSLPLVLKPDVGQRGIGVRMIRSWSDARSYLAEMPSPVLAQPYHPGPYEAGVFYYRLPDRPHGRLLSITDKVFPEVVGDGHSSLETLIWRHPRYRLQARTFLARHRGASSRVLAAGERFRLAVAGNHAQGTTFRDGRHLITPALEARIDEIARSHRGFYIGRFDIRYRNVDAFTRGHDLAIVELNGVTAESTNIYDPDASLWSAWRTLCRQWSLVFAIGAANRRNGAAVSSLRRMAGLARTHLTSRIAYELSD
jgi:membrane protein DedA with SNARE-associated domain